MEASSSSAAITHRTNGEYCVSCLKLNSQDPDNSNEPPLFENPAEMLEHSQTHATMANCTLNIALKYCFPRTFTFPHQNQRKRKRSPGVQASNNDLTLTTYFESMVNNPTEPESTDALRSNVLESQSIMTEFSPNKVLDVADVSGDSSSVQMSDVRLAISVEGEEDSFRRSGRIGVKREVEDWNYDRYFMEEEEGSNGSSSGNQREPLSLPIPITEEDGLVSKERKKRLNSLFDMIRRHLVEGRVVKCASCAWVVKSDTTNHRRDVQNHIWHHIGRHQFKCLLCEHHFWDNHKHFKSKHPNVPRPREHLLDLSPQFEGTVLQLLEKNFGSGEAEKEDAPDLVAPQLRPTPTPDTQSVSVE